MRAGWAVGAVVILAIAIWARGFVRGFVQAGKAGFRRDLITLGSMQELAEVMAKVSATTTYAFAPPRAEGRRYLIGWLWWSAQLGPEGKVERDMGWAPTYRRARKAAGLPVSWRRTGGEFVVAPDRAGMLVGDQASAGHSDQG